MGTAMMVAVGLLVSGPGAAAGGKPAAEPGKPAPAFTLRDQEGRKVTLAALRGRIVVLEWMNPDCPFWKRHAAAGTMKKLAEEYAEKGVTWLAVNSTAHMPIERDAWAREAFGLGYPVLNDRSGRVGRVYGAKTTPHMFVVDSRGMLVYSGAIDDDPEGEADAPVNHVKAALDDLLAGRPVATPETKPYGCSVKYAARRR